MKKVILSLGLLAAFTQAKAQGNLDKGAAQLNIGAGFSGWGIPVIVGADFGVAKSITVGAEGSFRSWNNVGYKFTIIGIGANANYHFNDVLELPEKMDLYAGVTLGYFIYSTPSGYPGASLSTIGLSGQAGFRYYISKKVALNIEAGGGSATSGGKVGVTFKL
ncbi:MAG: hypothetical protein IT256_00385 [Chitinophagaceae bacterium]|nr:hypothetical protein [Chitinophagaceae bacterium]